ARGGLRAPGGMGGSTGHQQGPGRTQAAHGARNGNGMVPSSGGPSGASADQVASGVPAPTAAAADVAAPGSGTVTTVSAQSLRRVAPGSRSTSSERGGQSGSQRNQGGA